MGSLTYTSGGLALLFCWLLCGDFAWSIRDRTLPATIQLLFQRFGASDTLVGILFFSLPALIGLIVGPVVAYQSDRLRSRWGRRIPFLAASGPFILVAIAGLALSPEIGRLAHRFGVLATLDSNSTVLILLGLSWTLFELACVTANSVLGALINDVVPQEVMGRFFGLFRACSLLAGIVVNSSIMGKSESHYTAIFLGVGIIYGLGFTLMCLKVKEGEYPPVPPAPAGKSRKSLAAIRTYFREGFGLSYYRWFFATLILTGLATMPFNIYSLFYAKSLGVSLDLYFKCLAVTYGISLFLSYPLGALVDRFHPLRISIAVIALYGIVMACGLFFVRDATSFMIVLIAHGVLSGSYYTTSASLGQRLLPKLKFAELSSAGGLVGALFGMGMPPLLGSLLDHTHHSYRYVFHVALGLAILGVLCGSIFHRQFLALGGPRNYVAPQPAPFKEPLSAAEPVLVYE